MTKRIFNNFCLYTVLIQEMHPYNVRYITTIDTRLVNLISRIYSAGTVHFNNTYT